LLLGRVEYVAMLPAQDMVCGPAWNCSLSIAIDIHRLGKRGFLPLKLLHLLCGGEISGMLRSFERFVYRNLRIAKFRRGTREGVLKIWFNILLEVFGTPLHAAYSLINPAHNSLGDLPSLCHRDVRPVELARGPLEGRFKEPPKPRLIQACVMVL